MKIKNIIFLLTLAMVSCQNNPTNSPDEQPPSQPEEVAYNCQVTKAQLLSVDSLVGVMGSLDPWGDDATLDSISDLNDDIEKQLKSLLTCATIETFNLDSESFDNLYYAQTPDGRIRNFHWC